MTEPDDDDGGVVEWLEDKLRRDYLRHLAAHPDPRDPDHPEPEDYGQETDND